MGQYCSGIFFFGFVIFILEFVLLHILQYAAHYIDAMLAISYALFGIGLAALFPFRPPQEISDTDSKLSEKPKFLGESEKTLYFPKLQDTTIFLQCLAGTWVFLLLALIKILYWRSVPILNIFLSMLFFFPGQYLIQTFRSTPSVLVVTADLLGGIFGLVVLIAAYAHTNSENIVLGILLLLALTGLATTARSLKRNKLWACVFIIFFAFTSFLILCQFRHRSFDLFKIAHYSLPDSAFKSFGGNLKLIKTYDNLVARVEVLQHPGTNNLNTSFDGYLNDIIDHHDLAWFTHDPRVIRGIIEQPSMLLLGSSAQGILKVARSMTSDSLIKPIEINPAIPQIIQHDFSNYSREAYGNTKIIKGNALAYIVSDPASYDVITLMNFHSTPRIYFNGPPDFIHTKEFYGLLLDHLNSHGYIMLEERPLGLIGKYSVFRIINTFYQAIKEKYASDPLKHFCIYRYSSIIPDDERIIALSDIENPAPHNTPLKPASNKYHIPQDAYVGILVSKNPLSNMDKSHILEFLHSLKTRYQLGHLETSSTPGLQKLFDSIKNNTLPSAFPGVDLSPVTRNRPFPFAVDKTYFRQIKTLLLGTGIFLFLFAMIIRRLRLSSPGSTRLKLQLLLFQTSAGIAYMLIENLCINVYQNEFLSFSLSFLGTLCIFLVSSAIGSYTLHQIRNQWLMIIAVIISFVPHIFLFSTALIMKPLLVRYISMILSIAVSGFFMGYFLPKGLNVARAKGLGDQTGTFFAANCIAGAFATLLYLYISVALGFLMTLIFALTFYIISGFLLPKK